MTDAGDRDLYRRFAALRRDDASAAPPFADTIASARARARAPRVTPWIVAAAAAAAVLVVLWAPDREPYPIDLAAATWRGPTDFLLQLPGAELLRTVPAVGRVSLSDSVIIDFDRRTP